eukprot:364962-Chlamydomonas_euryale.AAC.4
MQEPKTHTSCHKSVWVGACLPHKVWASGARMPVTRGVGQAGLCMPGTQSVLKRYIITCQTERCTHLSLWRAAQWRAVACMLFSSASNSSSNPSSCGSAPHELRMCNRAIKCGIECGHVATGARAAAAVLQSRKNKVITSGHAATGAEVHARIITIPPHDQKSG